MSLWDPSLTVPTPKMRRWECSISSSWSSRLQQLVFHMRLGQSGRNGFSKGKKKKLLQSRSDPEQSRS